MDGENSGEEREFYATIIRDVLIVLTRMKALKMAIMHKLTIIKMVLQEFV